MGDVVLQIQRMHDQKLEFVFFGMPVTFSNRVLEGLLRAGIRPSAIWMPDSSIGRSVQQLQPELSRSELPLVRPYLQQGIAQLAWEEEIPVYAVRDLSAPHAIELLESLHVSVGIVACFPLRLPREILTVPRCGFLNLHPSLLPAYRGPYPLFWTFRDGVQESGITLHQVDSELDTGDIVQQSKLFIPDGLNPKEADELFAAEGTTLILEALAGLQNGALARQAQREGASYFGRPSAEDFTIPTTWTAQRAYNFMRGTAEWQMPYRIAGDGFDLLVRAAIAYKDHGQLDTPYSTQDGESWIKFKRGTLHVSS